jgi:hypothetical protein
LIRCYITSVIERSVLNDPSFSCHIGCWQIVFNWWVKCSTYSGLAITV